MYVHCTGLDNMFSVKWNIPLKCASCTVYTINCIVYSTVYSGQLDHTYRDRYI